MFLVSGQADGPADERRQGARELEEGIALRASDIDVACVLGYGFPAFRGGPMHYAEEIGLPRVVETIRRLALVHDERWRPSPLLLKLAASGRKFSDAPL